MLLIEKPLQTQQEPCRAPETNTDQRIKTLWDLWTRTKTRTGSQTQTPVSSRVDHPWSPQISSTPPPQFTNNYTSGAHIRVDFQNKSRCLPYNNKTRWRVETKYTFFKKSEAKLNSRINKWRESNQEGNVFVKTWIKLFCWEKQTFVTDF